MKKYMKLIIGIILIAFTVVALFLSLPTGEEDMSQSFGLKQVIYVGVLIIGICIFVVSLKKIIDKQR